MLSRDELYHKLLFLIPDAKFSFWPDDGRELSWNDNKVTYHKLESWCICWLNENNKSCPSIDEIKLIDKNKIDVFIESKRKENRNKQYEKDLSIIAGFEIEKKSNPIITFFDYLDLLESKMPQ